MDRRTVVASPIEVAIHRSPQQATPVQSRGLWDWMDSRQPQQGSL